MERKERGKNKTDGQMVTANRRVLIGVVWSRERESGGIFIYISYREETQGVRDARNILCFLMLTASANANGRSYVYIVVKQHDNVYIVENVMSVTLTYLPRDAVR